MKLNVNSPLRFSLMSPVCFAESHLKSAALNIYSACEFISQSTPPKTIVAHKLAGSQNSCGRSRRQSCTVLPCFAVLAIKLRSLQQKQSHRSNNLLLPASLSFSPFSNCELNFSKNRTSALLLKLKEVFLNSPCSMFSNGL